MQLQPYIFYNGRCEEALNYYKSVLGGSYEIMRVSDTPPQVQEHMPGASPNQVMHASFSADGLSFLCSDGREQGPIDPDAGNISLAITANDAAHGERLCTALAEGGKVTMPYDDAFWGGKFGMIVDRFGIEWMITAH